MSVSMPLRDQSVSACSKCGQAVEVTTLSYSDGPHWVVSCRNDQCKVGVINPREAFRPVVQVP